MRFLSFALFCIYIFAAGNASAAKWCNPSTYTTCTSSYSNSKFCPILGEGISCEVYSMSKAECCLVDVRSDPYNNNTWKTIHLPVCNEYANKNGKLRLDRRAKRQCIPEREFSHNVKKVQELGSFFKSCKDCKVEEDKLICSSCPTKAGGEIPASIRLHKKTCNRKYTAHAQHWGNFNMGLKMTRGEVCY